MTDYKTLHELASDEYIIEKSRFIAHARPVDNEEEAREFIGQIKEKHKDATHNVWAYTLGMSMNIQRYSDDGEPSGTAGIPVLELIKKEELKNVVIVITRYFGGIKLGGGGLVRAYTKSAKLGVEASKIVVKKLFTELFIRIDYSLLGKLQNEIATRKIHLKDTEYSDEVCLALLVEKSNTEKIMDLFTELTNASAKISLGEDLYLSTVDGKILD